MHVCRCEDSGRNQGPDGPDAGHGPEVGLTRHDDAGKDRTQRQMAGTVAPTMRRPPERWTRVSMNWQ